MMDSTLCPGSPQRCEYARSQIAAATEGYITPEQVEAVRVTLADCAPCVAMLEVEVRLKVFMSRACHKDAPKSLQIRITAALQRINLDDLDVTDL